MSAKFLNLGAATFAALLAVTVLASDQVAIYDDLSDDFMSPSCRIGSPESWEGRPCVVPLRTWSADGTAVPR
jgi:hypothetical protein